MTDDNDADQVGVVPLTNWANPPTILALKQDYQDAKPAHETQVSKINTWIENLNVTGQAKIKVPKGNSSIVPKLIRKQAEWRYAALSEPFMSTDELYAVKPVSFEDRKAAQQNQLILNQQMSNAIDKQRFIDDYVRAAVDEGTVIVRTGWEFVEEEYDKEEPIVEFHADPEFYETLQYVKSLQDESPSEYMTDVPDELKQALELSIEKNVPYRPVITGKRTVKAMRTVKNRPTVEVCDVRNVVFDPTAMGVVEKCSFIIYSFEASMSQLKKDGIYKNLKAINIQGNTILSQPDHSGSDGLNDFNFSDTPRKKVVVYEYWGYWDIDNSGIVKPIVATWVGDTLIRLEENPMPDKELPFIVEQYLPVRRSMHGEPDGALLEDNQKIVGAVMRGMIDIMGKSASGQTGMRKDMLDLTNRKKFMNGEDYEFNVNVEPRQGIYSHVFPEIPQSAQYMIQLQNMEAESMTGVKAFSEGISGASLGKVASLGRGALDAASKREMGILRRLSSGIVKIGRKLIAMNAVFLDEEEVVRITNEEFVKVRRDDLAGRFDLKLTISTPEEDEKKAQELAMMLQTMGPNMDPELAKMILSDIARLRKMPEVAKKIETYEPPPPDPVTQRLRELEVELAEAKVYKEKCLAEAALAQAGLNGVKVGTEQAKAGALNAQTDKATLDFVEQESGVTQERNIQMAGEQARSQGQLKLMDHEMDREKQKVDLLKTYMTTQAKKKS